MGQLGTLSDILSIYPTDKSIRNLSQGNNTNATREISSNHSLPLFSNFAPMSISSHEVHPHWTLGPSCFFLAFAYMSLWTVVGSLISYFQKENGPDFFVKLNCAFYLPGLPVALLQMIYVSDLEVRFGSQPLTCSKPPCFLHGGADYGRHSRNSRKRWNMLALGHWDDGCCVLAGARYYHLPRLNVPLGRTLIATNRVSHARNLRLW